jgi:hypothetical protein
VTAIAYRNGVMAADSQDSCGGIRMGSVRKIAKRADGALAGAAGEAGFCEEFLSLFRDGRDEDYRPAVSDERPFSAIVVLPNGEPWQVGPVGRYRIEAPFIAEGSAYQIMIGAMAAGAGPERAVQIAIEYDTRCGGEIQVEILGG